MSHLHSEALDGLDESLVIDELHEPVLASALLSGGVHEDQEVGHRRGHAGVGEIDELRCNSMAESQTKC